MKFLTDDTNTGATDEMTSPVCLPSHRSLAGKAEGEPLLRVDGLSVEFMRERSPFRAVNNLGLKLDRGETLCLVGESGCGKSVTSMAIMGLIPDPPGRVVAGRILFDGTDLQTLPPHQRRRYRGTRMGMIFQEPGAALDPLFTIGDQLCEPLRFHCGMSRRAARAKAVELLHAMGIPAPERRIDDYPHRLSGGLKQRVVIASALSCNPDLLIADEPTTALDVTVQAQILRLLNRLKEERDLGMVFITHDLGVVAQIADRVAVLYAGSVVEEAPVAKLFREPLHPYTAGLLRSLPRLPEPGPDGKYERNSRLNTIPGTVPPTGAPVDQCPFAPRCPQYTSRCEAEMPSLQQIDEDHLVRCVLHGPRPAAQPEQGAPTHGPSPREVQP